MQEIHSGLASESFSIVYFVKFNKLTGPASDQKNIARLFLEKKILPSSCLYGLWKLLQSSILLRGSGGGVVGKCYWINMNTIILCYLWQMVTKIKGRAVMHL